MSVPQDNPGKGGLAPRPYAKSAIEDLGYLLDVERDEAQSFESGEMGVSIIRRTTIFRRQDGVCEPFIGSVIRYPLSGHN